MKKIIKATSIWAAITLLAIAGILLIDNATNPLSAFILSTMWILPIRTTLVELSQWSVVFICSNFQSVQRKLQSLTTVNDLTDPSKRSENHAFFRTLNWAITIICLVGAIFSWTFQQFSSNIIYLFIKNCITIWQKLAGSGGARFSILFWLVTEVLAISIIALYISLYPRGTLGNVNGTYSAKKAKIQHILAAIAFIFCRIRNTLIFHYSATMIWTMAIIWIVFFTIPVGIFIILLILLKIFK